MPFLKSNQALEDSFGTLIGFPQTMARGTIILVANASVYLLVLPFTSLVLALLDA